MLTLLHPERRLAASPLCFGFTRCGGRSRPEPWESDRGRHGQSPPAPTAQEERNDAHRNAADTDDIGHQVEAGNAVDGHDEHERPARRGPQYPGDGRSRREVEEGPAEVPGAGKARQPEIEADLEAQGGD